MSKRPNFGGTGMGSVQGLIKQAEKMQQQVEAEQANLATQELVGKSTDDMVVATFNGNRQLKNLKTDREAVGPDDPDMLQDLVIDAVDREIKTVDDATRASMRECTKGLM